MALHRKQRGAVDAAPQYVRIPTSSRAAGYSLHEAHTRVYAKRYAAGDRSRKISSLQLRACFVLCVLLYFGAIYFADDIASVGRVVGSEQNSQNFFVHSLRPRGRGHVRVGRAVDAKRVDATPVPAVTSAAPAEVEEQEQQQDDPPTEAPVVETQSPATAETEEAQATEPPGQPDTKVKGKTPHQDEPVAIGYAPGDAIHPDDQGDNVAVHQTEEPSHEAVNAMNIHEEQAATPSTKRVEPSHKINHDPQEMEQEVEATPAPTKHADKVEPDPTAALRLPVKEAVDSVLPVNAVPVVDPVLLVDAVPAASPARGEQQHVQNNVESHHLELPKRPAKPDLKPSLQPSPVDNREQTLPGDGQQEQHREEVDRQQDAAAAEGQHGAVDDGQRAENGQQEPTAADGQHGAVDGQQEEQLAETTRPAAQMAEHISDI
ncbi:Ligand-gated channel protein [Phytophthora cinnamomi]|uniref:Ligand-gated channel protein n=1 Tax=Phytophthora cinnamomi TaxID=4785 RepID=UPI003559D598|nr:Ligand-gated channel protein [Phytophthora cinnamomi]